MHGVARGENDGMGEQNPKALRDCFDLFVVVFGAQLGDIYSAEDSPKETDARPYQCNSNALYGLCNIVSSRTALLLAPGSSFVALGPPPLHPYIRTSVVR